VESDDGFTSFMLLEQHLSAANRPLRMRLARPDGNSDDVLLPQRINGFEAMCDGLEYRVLCVADDACLPLKDFIALPVELQIVTDQGTLRSICGIVTEASAGESDGGLATYQLVIRDALAIMEKRVSTRIFRTKNELEIVEIMFTEWRQSNPVMAAAFDFEFDQALALRKFPRREFTMQHNESDAAFVRRLLKRRGVSWYFRAGRAESGAPKSDGQDKAPAHTLVMFDDENRLKQNAAGTVRYHRDDATEERDTITAWSAMRMLQAGSTTRHSWDYGNALGTQFMMTNATSMVDQGVRGKQFAASLNDYVVEMPHAGDNHEDHCKLGQLRMAHYDYASKCFHGEGGLRALCVAEWVGVDGHPEIDRHPAAEREFVITAQHVTAYNNLPKELNAKIERLFARSRWGIDSADALSADQGAADTAIAYRTRFTCVRRGIQIVPDFDPRVDLPHPQLQSAIVVGPSGEEVHCDAQGRVKVRFPGTRGADHQHAHGAGASNTDADSAFVRVASSWAGNGSGSHHQCGTVTLPRIGTEVLIAFMGGDPDKPVIVGQLFNHLAPPPALGNPGDLPDDRYLSGMKTREVHGMRANQLRFDDTPGQISAQVASEHGASELNLGWLHHPRNGGNADPRGEGAELRSDKAVAVRGGQGVLISADASVGAQGAQLDRDELVGLAEVLQGVAAEISKLAATHAGDEADGPQLAQLLGKLKNWSAGSNAGKGAQIGAGGSQPGGQPIIAASASAGMVLASQDNVLMGAQSKIDILCVNNAQVSTGRNLFLRAAQSISLFAHQLGMKLVAASGSIVVQAHHGDIEITTSGRIRMNAGQGIDLSAPEIKIVAQGAQADYGGGTIRQQSSGAHAIKSSSFAHVRPGGGSPPDLKFPGTTMETDERIVYSDRQTGLPFKGRRYTATLADGKTISGVTDDHGRTELMKDKDMNGVVIAFDDAE